VTPRPVLVALAAALAVGCGAEEDEREPLWPYISAVIIQPNCATSSCHSKGAAAASLDLSNVDRGYADLLGDGRSTSVTPTARPMVVPGNPGQSRVVNMLRASGARRMPPDRPLAEADIQLVEIWILKGALFR